MANIHSVFKDEDVSGDIVGGEYFCGVLFYEGRQQGNQLYAKDENSLISESEKLKKRCYKIAEMLSVIFIPMNRDGF